MEEGFFDPCNRPVQVEIRSGFRIEIGRTSAWDPILVDHVERHFGVAREHIDTFFQLPATIRSDYILDVFLRNLPKICMIEH